MVAFTPFSSFKLGLLEGVHDFTSDSFYLLLTNTAPDSGASVKSELTEITEGAGYVAGGALLTLVPSVVGSVAKLTVSQIVFTAVMGVIGPFRYLVVYNNDADLDYPLVGYSDYGASFTLHSGHTFTWGDTTFDLITVT